MSSRTSLSKLLNNANTQNITAFNYLARLAKLPTGLYNLLALISSFFTRSKAISVSTGPIFTIFSPNGR